MTDDRAAFTEARDAGLAIRQQRRIETREELRRRTRREVAEEIAAEISKARGGTGEVGSWDHGMRDAEDIAREIATKEAS